MPITASAKKALRQSYKRREFNLKRLNEMKAAVKDTRKTKTEKPEEAAKSLSAAYKAIDKAAKRGVIKKGAADRKKSRLAKFLAKKS
ncbi:30S ribosomal protein S20 [Candidatus Parcubacteria bacterium]|nr:MAG: 30S ribosomal protein S20 [Candidatus Parcubacteria bacterium]